MIPENTSNDPESQEDGSHISQSSQFLSTRIIAYSIGVILSIVYGLTCQAVVRFPDAMESYKVSGFIMSLGMVFILPTIIGFITVYFSQSQVKQSLSFQIFAPWVSVLISLLITLIVGWEGSICLIMAIPIYLPMGSLGGILAGMYEKVKSNRANPFLIAGLLILPIGSGAIEQNFDLPKETRHVYTNILIHSDVQSVWKNIAEIPMITEPQYGFFYFMGFPKALEATLSHPGVGGIRAAKFEKGLEFTETITQWEEGKKIVFTIVSNPEFTPLTTLDPHVVVGGEFFDTLEGGYEIESLEEGKTLLHLYSEYRLSTRFNFYSGLWSDFLMRDIQNNILRVIRKRSENYTERSL